MPTSASRSQKATCPIKTQKSIGVYLTDPPDNLDEVLQYIEENYFLEAVIKEKPVYRLHGSGK